MWSAIERGYKHLSVDEKREVEIGAGPLGRGVRFSGFDAESEIAYRDIAHVLVEEAGQFERFQGRNLDAHMPALAGYRRMLRLYGPMRSAAATAGSTRSRSSRSPTPRNTPADSGVRYGFAVCASGIETGRSRSLLR